MAKDELHRPDLTDVFEVHGWKIGRITGDDTLAPPEGYHISTNAGGEYFLWADLQSEYMLVWIRITDSAGSVFSTCSVPAHVNVWHERKEVGYCLLKPELTSRP